MVAYKGNPVAVHHWVERMAYVLFTRWLALFDESCREPFDADVAGALRGNARRIAESPKLAPFYCLGRPWRPEVP